MTIEYIKKDITTVGVGIIVHGVNCQHEMASGVAKAIRAKFPKAYESYMNQPKGNTMLGTAFLVEIENGLFVANCYTQLFYGYGGGAYADKLSVFDSLHLVFNQSDYHDLPIFMPRIGCGLGGLDWTTDVQPIIEELNELYPRVKVFVCDL